MKPIMITEERMNYILPQNIKDTDVISTNAKKVLATIMNYHLVLDKVKTQGYVNLSNQLLRQSSRIKQNDMMSAIQELTDYNLIEREVGKVWTEGQPHIASKYTVIWNNLQQPLKKKSFEDLFSQFLKPSGTPMGTIVLDTVSVSVLDTEIVEDSEIESETDSDTDTATDSDEVEEVETEKRQFKTMCYIPIEIEEEVQDEETLAEYQARMKRKKMVYTN